MVHPIRHTVGGDKGVHQRFCGCCLLLEYARPEAQRLFVVLADYVWAYRELHLAQIDDSVGTVYYQVYLRPFLFRPFWRQISPCRRLGGNARYAEAVLYLVQMHQADEFKRHALPRLYGVGLEVVVPPLLILAVVLLYETFPRASCLHLHCLGHAQRLDICRHE